MIAYISALGGIEITEIQHGIEDYVICETNCWAGKRTRHRVKIHYETGQPYIVLYGHRYHLDDAIRA